MNGGAGQYKAGALKSPRTMNGLPVPPLLMPPRKAEKWKEEEEKGGWGGGRVFTLDKFHLPLGNVVGDFISGTAPEGPRGIQRAFSCEGS